MSKSAKAIKVDDVEYLITQIGGVEGLDLFDRVTGELGPAVVNAVRQTLATGQLTDAAIAAIAAQGFIGLSLPLKRDLRTKFAQLTTINAGSFQAPLCPPDGKLTEGDLFDQHFAGRFPHMQKWLLAAMRWGFAGFLPSLGDSDGKNQETPTTSP